MSANDAIQDEVTSLNAIFDEGTLSALDEDARLYSLTTFAAIDNTPHRISCRLSGRTTISARHTERGPGCTQGHG